MQQDTIKFNSLGHRVRFVEKTLKGPRPRCQGHPYIYLYNDIWSTKEGRPPCDIEIIITTACYIFFIICYKYRSSNRSKASPKWCLFSIPPPSQDCSFPLGLGRERYRIGILKGCYINFD